MEDVPVFEVTYSLRQKRPFGPEGRRGIGFAVETLTGVCHLTCKP
jgi:hypothetical protein